MKMNIEQEGKGSLEQKVDYEPSISLERERKYSSDERVKLQREYNPHLRRAFVWELLGIWAGISLLGYLIHRYSGGNDSGGSSGDGDGLGCGGGR